MLVLWDGWCVALCCIVLDCRVLRCFCFGRWVEVETCMEVRVLAKVQQFEVFKFPHFGDPISGFLGLAGVGSNFLRKGTAETRLFGEGKCCIFREDDLDRGWCNIHGGAGVGCSTFGLRLRAAKGVVASLCE